jgi:hypothetical protein
MARRAAVAAKPDATPREVRTWLLEQDELPEGVTVGARGRLSAAAKDYFTAQTGQGIVVAEAPAAE